MFRKLFTPESLENELNEFISQVENMKCKQKNIFIIASFFLILGISCYAFFYPNKFHSLSFGEWKVVFYKIEIQNSFLLSIIYSLTSFCHIIFMTLYSIAITNSLKFKSVIHWSLFWGLIDSAFELMQLKETSINSNPSHFWIINKVNYYLENGAFDIWDLVVIWLAVLILILFWKILCNIDD